MKEWNVKGVLFADYVRMLRAQRHVDWSLRLPPEDLSFLVTRIEPDGWYPMATFERLGLAILDYIAGGEVELVHTFGQSQVDGLVGRYPTLLAEGDPRESVMRFHVLRQTFFSFPALEVRSVSDAEALLHIDYRMGPRAEHAAAVQAQGFFERLVELAGGREVRGTFERKGWEAGGGPSHLALEWQ
jgi:hypothetical protein